MRYFGKLMTVGGLWLMAAGFALSGNWVLSGTFGSLATTVLLVWNVSPAETEE
jgi:hypothetical protein